MVEFLEFERAGLLQATHSQLALVFWLAYTPPSL